MSTGKEFEVDVLCTTVPGAIKDGVFNVSLVLSPYRPPPVSSAARPSWSLPFGQKADLRTLPAEVVDGSKSQFVLFLHRLDGSIDMIKLGVDSEFSKRQPEAEALWAKVFNYPSGQDDDYGFRMFMSVLNDPVEIGSRARDGSNGDAGAAGSSMAEKTTGFSVTQLSDFFRDQRVNLMLLHYWMTLVPVEEIEARLQALNTKDDPKAVARLRRARDAIYHYRRAPYSNSLLKRLFTNELTEALLSNGTDSAADRLSAAASLSGEPQGSDVVKGLKAQLDQATQHVAKLAEYVATNANQDFESDLSQEFTLPPSSLGVHNRPELFLDSLIPNEENILRLGDAYSALQYYVHEYRRAVSFQRGNPGLGKKNIRSRSMVSESELRQGVRRKMAGLRSHPTLAKFLRMIHDFKVKVDEIKDPSSVEYVSAAFVDIDFNRSNFPGPDWEKKITKTAVNLEGDKVNTIRSRAEILSRRLDPVPRFKQFMQTRKIAQYILPNGLINLNIDGRYRLNILDSSQAIHVMTSTLTSEKEKLEAGATDRYTNISLPGLRARGIELLDEASRFETVFDVKLTELRAQGNGADIVNELFAEDLDAGFRIDILRTRTNDPADVAVPHPAMARLVYYPEINKAYGEPEDEYFHPYKDFAHRDEGSTRPMHRVRQKGTGDEIVASPRLVLWTGEPLGMPAGETDVLDRRLDLPIEICFEPPKLPVWPALREGDRYRFAARVRYPNGDGPKFLLGESEKNWKEIYGEVALGNVANGTPFPFAPPDRIAAPPLLFREDDRLLKIPRNGQQVVPDKLQTVVLRSLADGSFRGDVPRRIVAPPLISFEQAEQQGQFDGEPYDDDDIPASHPNMADVEWDERTLGFPHVNSQLVTVEFGPADQQNGSIRGPVFRGRKNEAAHTGYYLDNRTRKLSISLYEMHDESGLVAGAVKSYDTAGKHAAMRPTQIVFYPEAELDHQNWVDSELPPVKIPSSEGRKPVTVDQVGIHLLPGSEAHIYFSCPISYEDAVQTNHFVNWLFSAERESGRESQPASGVKEIHKEFFSKLSRSIGFGSNMEPLTKSSDAEQKLDQTPSDVTNEITTIRAIHAVQKPLVPPVIPNLNISYRQKKGGAEQMRSQRALRFVRHDGGLEDWATALAKVPKPEDYADGKAYAEAWLFGIDSVRTLEDGTQLNASSLKDSVGATSAFVVGQVDIDRITTHALRGEMIYLDVNAPGSKRKSPDGDWEFVPVTVTRNLFDIKDIAKALPGKKTLPGKSDRLDLAFDDAGKPRGNAVDVGQRAMRVAVRLIAISRFEDYFDENIKEFSGEADDGLIQEGELGFSEAENKPHGELTNAIKTRICPGIETDSTVFAEEYWIASTMRPPGPDVRSLELLFQERTLARDERSIVVEKSVVVRFRMGDHFATGEGELIAIIMLPGDLVSDYPVSCPDDGYSTQNGHIMTLEEHKASEILKQQDMSDFGYETPLGRSVTSWGTDPTTDSGRLDPFILPSQFSGWAMKRRNLKLPLQDDEERAEEGSEESEGDAAKFADVAVMGFEPQIDPETGDWVVDVGMDATAADSPFIRFSLARCQLNSIAGKNLELSAPALQDPIQIPPRRQVEVQFLPDADSGRIVVINVTGIGYLRRNPGYIVDAKGDELKRETAMPMQNFRLMRRAATDLGFVQAYGRAGDALESLGVLPVQQDAGLKWSTRFTLPDDIDLEDLQLSVFETEFNVPDHDENLPTKLEVETLRPFAIDIALAPPTVGNGPAAKPPPKPK